MSILRSKVFVDIPTDKSISELMTENVSHTPPNKIIYEDSLNGKTFTYGTFGQQVRRSAYVLSRELGLSPGKTVTVIGPSHVDYVLAVHSIWWAGAVMSTINNSLHPREIAYAIDLVRPDFLVLHHSMYDTILEVAKFLEKVQLSKIWTLGTPHPTWTPFPTNDSNNVTSQELPVFSLGGKDSSKHQAAILLSSGTTGTPKAVVLSHYNLVAACLQLRSDNPTNWRGSQREIFFPPLSHVYALYVTMTMCWWLGAYVCLLPRFDTELYCRLMSERKATLARLVPPIAKLLAESPVVKKYTYPSLEYFSCSAAPLNAKIATALRHTFPGVALCQTYGATELSGPCAQSGVRDEGLPLIAAGKLITNTEMRFLDLDGKGVGMKGPGEITVRGPNVFMGYKDNPAATAETIIDKDWYRTGDLGYMDDNGYLVIYDRLKDIMKYKGFQVSPGELEEVIVQHPLVNETAVCGVWSEADASELPRAYVVLHDQKKRGNQLFEAASSIAEFVAGRVSNYKQLRGGVVFLDRLPKNHTGKVLRKVLRAENAKHEPQKLQAKL